VFSDSQPASSLRGFEILRRLGVGGAGEVFLARSKGGRLVAIKTLAGAAEDATFAREAALCARLIHPAIVQVRAFFDDPGAPALVFDYVPGVALSRLLRFCATHRVRLPDEPAWHIVERVLSALAYAHAQKDAQQQPTPIVHRDVSPANVLVDWNGGVKLADFGIAKMIGVSPATRVGLVKGTLGCMAPEQARGETVTERADVYAAALLAWRLATGRVPFAKYANDELELLRAMRNPRVKSLSVLRPDLPASLADAIDIALRADPGRRTITAEELAVAVRASFDLSAGRVELAALLARWKPALERSVRRGAAGEGASIARAETTMRYEELALAFADDDDAPSDGPTIEAHALPSDPAMLAALPVDIDGDISTDELSDSPPRRPLSSPPPPPATLDTVREIVPLGAFALHAPTPLPIVVTPPRRARTSPRIAVAVAVALLLAFAAYAATR
jgi:serine/threonine protein kinase